MRSVYITRQCGSQLDPSVAVFNHVIGRAKVLRRDAKGEAGIKVHSSGCISLRAVGNGDRLFCFRAPVNDMHIFIPFEVASHQRYSVEISDMHKLDQKVEIFQRSVKVVCHSLEHTEEPPTFKC